MKRESAHYVVRHSTCRRKRYLLILCPLGHLLESHPLDASFGGSALEADLGQHGCGRPVDRWDRAGLKCQGFGH